jgi:hypothetical protein
MVQQHTHSRPFVRMAMTLGTAWLCAACSDEQIVQPTAVSHAAHGNTARASASSNAFGELIGTAARFINTALGEQPRVTPMMRIESPTQEGRVRANELVTIRVRYSSFDFRPDLRTPNAGTTLGSQPQTVVNGVVQGHIHGYLQRLPDDGSLPDANAVSFCVLDRSVERNGYDGIAEGECPAVAPGTYRLSAEFQSHSHTSILKTGPRATVTGDLLTVRVR